MRSTSALATLVAIAASGTIGASTSVAQTRLTSIEDLRRELAAGDVISVVPAAGPPVAGRLMRLGAVDLEIRPVRTRGQRDVTIALDAVRSLERPRDPVRNGVIIGAGVGAGFVGAMLVHAIAVDRNEMDEWAPVYATAGAVFTGVGALVGWAVDVAQSKPHIWFDAASERRTNVRVEPLLSRGLGIGVAVRW